MRKGLAVSPGVVVGTAYCIHDAYCGDEDETGSLVASEEMERYEQALVKTAADLHALYQKVATQVGQAEAAIFQAHESILKDTAFTRKVRNWIAKDGLSAPLALRRLLVQYTTMFKRTKDEYLRERLADVRDVILRLNAHISDTIPAHSSGDGPLILVAEELLPSHAVMLGTRDVAGIVTQTGGSTSHAAILARSRGIPAVSGVRGILAAVRTGTLLVVDGRQGHVIVDPTPDAAVVYRKLQQDFVHFKDALAANRDQPALDKEGNTVEILANINHAQDAAAAVAMGAAGVGLFRTEYLFLAHPDVPDEDEQCEAYREVIKASPSRRVTIRTLDLGGDKTIPYMGHTREANPFLGWRSIRLSFEHPKFFTTQIRAILRAAGDSAESPRDVRILFPMITTLEEMRRVRAIVRRAARALSAEGHKVAHVPIGMMLEVPAAAICIDRLLEVTDFVSIGSNDLVQYLMAADRDNPKVNHLCQPLSTAVLRVLNDVIHACNAAGKPITLCGEMAGNARAFILLHGMGLRSFSMSPAFIPTIKELLRHLTGEQTNEILGEAMRLRTASQVIRFCGEKIAELAPQLAGWDTA